MKKLLSLLMIIGTIMLVSCADKKTINGVTYRPYGFLNESTCKNDSIEYQLSFWATVSGVVFFECIVPPIYTFGFNLFEPVGLKGKKSIKDKDKGIVK